MRTWLALAAVLAVGAAAVADALHGQLEDASSPSAPGFDRVARIVPPGVPAGFMGAVYYSDAADGCRLHALALPGFAGKPPPKFRGCFFSLSPDGETALASDAVWSAEGGLVAIPDEHSFELASTDSSHALHVEGTAPAFKPDGTLTYVRDGDLVEWTTRCELRDGLFTLPGDNATARCVRVLSRAPVRSVAWLSNSRFAAITARGRLVIAEAGRVVIRRSLPSGRGRHVEPSARGTFFTLWIDGRLTGAFDRAGRQIAFPRVPGVRSVAWAPSERWALLATVRGAVYLFRPNTLEARLRRLDIVARDVAWR
jgi:hypothetical protein